MEISFGQMAVLGTVESELEGQRGKEWEMGRVERINSEGREW